MTAVPASDPPPSHYELTLFVSGASGLSARAVVMAKRLCDVYAAGQFHLTIVDVHEDPDAALSHDVSVTPTLIKHFPLPPRRVVGDLSDTGRVLAVLDFCSAEE